MRFYRCDRCGKELKLEERFEFPEMPKYNDKIKTGYVGLYYGKKYPFVLDNTVDLCENCVMDLIKFINGEEIEKVNENNTMV